MWSHARGSSPTLGRSDWESDTFLDLCDTGIAQLDSAGMITSARGPWVGLVGYSPDTLEGVPLSVFFPTLVSPSHGRHIVTFDHPDGRTLWLELTIERDEVDQMSLTARDITSQVVDNRPNVTLPELTKLHQIAQVGELAAASIHDLNNMLAVVLAHAELLSRHVADSSQADDASRIVDATIRGRELIQQVLRNAREDRIGTGTVDPFDTLSAMRSSLEMLVGHEMKLGLVMERTGLLAGERLHLEQIIMNLVVNARDASKRGDTVRIEVVPDANRWCVIRVVDRGAGMTDAVQRRMFEPGFTTKSNGSGLGLGHVRRLVAGFRGTMTIESMPARGTCIELRLPLTRGRNRVRQEAASTWTSE